MQNRAPVMPLPVIVVQVLFVCLIHSWTTADGKLIIFLDRDRTWAKKEELSRSTVTNPQGCSKRFQL